MVHSNLAILDLSYRLSYVNVELQAYRIYPCIMRACV